MPKLGSVAAGHPKTVKVEYGGEVFGVTYDVARYTGVFEAEIATATADGKPVATACAFVAGLVMDWDVLDDNEKPYPITMESVLAFPAEFTGLIVQAIVEDARPGEANGSFGAGSPAAD